MGSQRPYAVRLHQEGKLAGFRFFAADGFVFDMSLEALSRLQYVVHARTKIDLMPTPSGTWVSEREFSRPPEDWVPDFSDEPEKFKAYAAGIKISFMARPKEVIAVQALLEEGERRFGQKLIWQKAPFFYSDSVAKVEDVTLLTSSDVQITKVVFDETKDEAYEIHQAGDVISDNGLFAMYNDSELALPGYFSREGVENGVFTYWALGVNSTITVEQVIDLVKRTRSKYPLVQK